MKPSGFGRTTEHIRTNVARALAIEKRRRDSNGGPFWMVTIPSGTARVTGNFHDSMG